ncbi:hypothetical protein ACFQZ4_09445 [Catellatospora coxensis]
MTPRRALHALWLAVVPLIAAVILTVATPAAAATLTEVTGFGANPGSLRMFLYVPNTVAPRRPCWSRCTGATATGRRCTTAPTTPGSPTSTASSWSTRR